jgi:lathosterol oxidase
MSTSVQRLKIGEGKISGYSSIFLGLLSLTGVICFKYPEWLHHNSEKYTQGIP